jgi:hypothetical protein
MTIDVVVAHFNEDLSWTKTVIPTRRVVVYNKGEDEDGLLLPNVGREAHTYLHHILVTYSDLAECTFFTQGDPNAHLPLSHLQGIINRWPNSQHRGALRLEGGPMFFVNEPVRYLEETPQNEDVHNDPRGLWRELFTNEPPEDILFAPAAIFAISRDKLLSRSFEFYRKALGLAVSRKRGPWEFERLWAYLWRPKDTPRL